MIRFDRFTEKAQEVFRDSTDLLEKYKHNQLDVEHIFYTLAAKEGVGQELLKEMGVPIPGLLKDLEMLLTEKPSVSTTVGQQIYITPRLEMLVKSAQLEAERLKDEFIGIEHLLIAISQDPNTALRRVLYKYGITPEAVYQALSKVRGAQRVTDREAESRYKALERFSINLTALAREGKLDPVIGRSREIRRAVQILSRRKKNNPVFIGEPGVGKTAIVEGARAADRRRRRPRQPQRQRVGPAGLGRARRGHQVPRGVRGAPQGRDQRDRERQGQDYSLY
jgi:ATP-dependent Clp protease ATP-binding subunit ClpC